MEWQSAWDDGPVSCEDYLQMTAFIYQRYKHVLDRMPVDGSELLKTYFKTGLTSSEDRAVLAELGIVDDPGMGKRLLRWLVLDMPKEA